MVNTNRLMFANDYQRLQLIFVWLLSPYYPNYQSFTRKQFRNLLTINAKRKPSSDFLSLWHFQTEKRKENHGHAYAPQGAMGLKLWDSLASKLAAYPIALAPHLWCQA